MMEPYVTSLIRMLSQMGYTDINYSSEDRRLNLRHVYLKTIAHFTQSSACLGTDVKRMQAFIQTIVRMMVYSYPKLPLDVMSDLSVYYTYTVILDDCKQRTADTMQTFTVDLIHGSEQRNPWWQAVNQHLPSLLKHYSPFCSLTIFRSTLDFFQGCWIEEHGFQGFNKSHNYPEFLRRMNGLGHCVGASLFPKQDFDESKHVPEISTVIAEMEQWEMHVNDLLSFYKESSDSSDQANFVTNYAHCTGCSVEDSLSRLTDSVITSGNALRTTLADKDGRIKEVVEGFMQGFVTWHLTDPRYRIQELVQQTQNSRLSGQEKLTTFWKAAMEVGDVDHKLWAFPPLQEMMHGNE
ncbi:hypothetical protein D6C89_07212 [Aureobasidium pullulans]|uniref:Trichodiene synthase n=1 Tax=Aureobasidium pullulans TaxID=5580 RepID=A0A4S8W0X2_AURPU|nr:hypothetical protein D6D24_03832 [Aureobasidium pullulans]THZ20405.1 hypothetical protein D6C89_07212 [Aureobasidium pullulans]